MKHRTVCNAIYSILLIAFLWAGSIAGDEVLPKYSQISTTSLISKIKQNVGQTPGLAEKKEVIEETSISFLSTSPAGKWTVSSFFLSSALTQHFLNSTINDTI